MISVIITQSCHLSLLCLDCHINQSVIIKVNLVDRGIIDVEVGGTCVCVLVSALVPLGLIGFLNLLEINWGRTWGGLGDWD